MWKWIEFWVNIQFIKWWELGKMSQMKMLLSHKMILGWISIDKRISPLGPNPSSKIVIHQPKNTRQTYLQSTADKTVYTVL